MEDVFTRIYLENGWKSAESRSGPSSTLARTKTLRDGLPQLMGAFNIRTIVDAPCGDFNWMRSFVEGQSFSYIGGDIVLPMIKDHQAEFKGNRRVKFKHLDITQDKLPQADLMLCRDCLFHFSYEDTLKVLKNFLSADIPYLLTTTHYNKGQIVNRDIRTGGWRMMDLFEAPYNFPADVLFRIVDGGGDREMCLWSRDQVAEVVAHWPQ